MRSLFEPSAFAEKFDSGHVIESFFGIVQEDQENAFQNKAFGTQATYAHASYFRTFHFEPATPVDDTGSFAAELKRSIEDALQSEGFTLQHKTASGHDISILYKSKARSGTVELFVTKTTDSTVQLSSDVQLVTRCAFIDWM